VYKRTDCLSGHFVLEDVCELFDLQKRILLTRQRNRTKCVSERKTKSSATVQENFVSQAVQKVRLRIVRNKGYVLIEVQLFLKQYLSKININWGIYI
jgi:hypothetical protein